MELMELAGHHLLVLVVEEVGLLRLADLELVDVAPVVQPGLQLVVDLVGPDSAPCPCYHLQDQKEPAEFHLQGWEGSVYYESKHYTQLLPITNPTKEILLLLIV